MSIVSKLESSIEGACTNYASAKGIICIKLVKLKGIPDKLFCFNGRVIFVEFKRPNEKSRKIQEYWHKVLCSNGFSTYIVSDINSFKNILKDNFNV